MVQRVVVQTEKEYNEGVRYWFFAIIFFAIPVLLIYMGYLTKEFRAFWIGIVWLGLVIYFKFIRKWLNKGRRKQGKRSQNKGWERIDRLPNWADRKMKRRKTNNVNGEHYRYMRKKGKFYRRRKS